ncbi:hypothetical protein [Streptomyces sp. NRRL B-3229]|uniref:hypothetical protein n=1 Tax=Streptomyces sp. NRRL B-3229 TaxID=1463836 RepID=UPI0004C071DA|nr:hypothetical protein [Streptomyces sp. NRRL B-3229]
MRRLAIPVLFLTLLVGCASQEPSASGTSSASPSAQGSIPRPSSPAGASYTFRLPLAVYSYSDADYEVIRSAEQVLARDCMKDFGLSYRPAKNPAPADAQDRRYGLTDRASAERYGYRMPPRPETPKAKLTEDQIKVLYGNRSAPAPAAKNPQLRYRGKKVPDEGCLGAAVLGFRKPYEDVAGAEVASRISTASYENSQKVPEVRAVFGKWSSCMKQKGYDYASPMAAMAAPAFVRGEVSAVEKDTAQADVSCKERTGLADVWFAAESSIQKSMIKADAEALRRLGELHEKKLRAARKILAGA